jgi:hypothetical protein
MLGLILAWNMEKSFEPTSRNEERRHAEWREHLVLSRSFNRYADDVAMFDDELLQPRINSDCIDQQVIWLRIHRFHCPPHSEFSCLQDIYAVDCCGVDFCDGDGCSGLSDFFAKTFSLFPGQQLRVA